VNFVHKLNSKKGILVNSDAARENLKEVVIYFLFEFKSIKKIIT
jgi:hypothetical protein